jgi:hypothetical protein
LQEVETTLDTETTGGGDDIMRGLIGWLSYHLKDSSMNVGTENIMNWQSRSTRPRKRDGAAKEKALPG